MLLLLVGVVVVDDDDDDDDVLCYPMVWYNNSGNHRLLHYQYDVNNVGNRSRSSRSRSRSLLEAFKALTLVEYTHCTILYTLCVQYHTVVVSNPSGNG